MYKAPSYAAAIDDRLKTYFDGTDYDSMRDGRSVEICTDMDTVKKELWDRFNLNMPRDYPSDKQSIMAQQLCLGYFWSWCSTLGIIDNSLVLERRSSCGTPTTVTIVDDIVTDKWHPIVVNAHFSNSNDGCYAVWFDETSVNSAEGINLGFDDAWNSDSTVTTGVGFKTGQYKAGSSSASLFESVGHPKTRKIRSLKLAANLAIPTCTDVWNNGTRPLYFHNVSWYNVNAGQTDGYDVVRSLI